MASIDAPPAGEVRRLTPEFARLFGSRKSDLVSATPTGSSVLQVGAASLESGLPPWPSLPAPGESVIETFVVERRGDPTPTSDNQPYVDAWLPLATALRDRVFDAIEAFDIPVDGPAYVTASITPPSAVGSDPHVDDDQFVADDGVGLVAIVADRAGSRVATGAIEQGTLRSPTQLTITDELIAAFDANELAIQHSAAGQIVLFPQFGQLHAGPAAGTVAGGSRQLLVLRATTRPLLGDLTRE